MPVVARTLRSWPGRVLVMLPAAVAALTLALGTVPAAATAVSPTVNPDGTYCVFNSATGALACVDDEKDYDVALRAADVVGDTAGDVGGISDPGTGWAADPGRTPGSMQTQYLLGRFYDRAGFSTADGYIDWFAPATCTASTSDIDSSWIDTTTWRSRISSFHAYSNCLIKVWSNVGYSGSSLGYAASRSNVGDLNDHIWSVRFT